MKWKILAGLRFLLALIVVCYHLKDFIPNYGKDLFCQFGKLNGLAAVIVFLIISGYSIAHSFFKKQEGFYQRRLLRIYPLYLCSIIVPFLVFLTIQYIFKIPINQLSNSIIENLGLAVGNLLFLQTFLIKTISYNIVLWSLSLEFLCYLLTPVFAKMKQITIGILIGLSAIFYISLPYIYHWLYPNSEYPFPNVWLYGITFFLFLWAWLLGFIYHFHQNQVSFKVIVITIGFLVLTFNQNHTGKLAIVTYIINTFIFIEADKIKLPEFVLKSLNYLGDISYPLYLFHIPTLILASSVLKIKNSLILVILCLLVAIIFYHTVDIPLRFKKNRV